MTASQLLLMLGIMLIGHDLNPPVRVVLGTTLGLWGVLVALGTLLFY